MKAMFTFFATIFLAVVMFTILSIQPRYHLVLIEEDGQQYYALQHCTYTGCRVYGSRWDITDKGLADARKEYRYFAQPEPKQKILATIE